MQEIEAKQHIGASEGGNIFFTLCFLAATGLIQANYSSQTCADVNLKLLVQLIFYGLLIWAAYLLITILPNCKSPQIQNFFTFIHSIFAIYLLSVFIYANTLYFDDAFKINNCNKNAPILAYFTTLFIYVGFVILTIIAFSLFSSVFRRFSKISVDERYAIEEL